MSTPNITPQCCRTCPGTSSSTLFVLITDVSAADTAFYVSRLTVKFCCKQSVELMNKIVENTSDISLTGVHCEVCLTMCTTAAGHTNQSTITTHTVCVLCVPDPRVEDWLLMKTPVPIAAIFILYLIAVFWGPRLMARHPPLDLKYVIIIYNLGLVLLSMYMFFEVSSKMGMTQCFKESEIVIKLDF